MLKRTALAMLVVAGSVHVALAQSKPAPPPVFSTTPPTTNKVVSEEQYYFSLRHYSPPVDVKVVPREKASYDSPEMAAIAAISAMVTGDYDWFRSTWDKASLALMDARDKAENQTPEFWVKAWDEAFRNRMIQLTARIDSGDYVMIVYRLVGQPDAASPAKPAGADVELITVLKPDNGKWVATQALSQDPVLLYWKTPGTRLKRMVRPPHQEPQPQR